MNEKFETKAKTTTLKSSDVPSQEEIEKLRLSIIKQLEELEK